MSMPGSYATLPFEVGRDLGSSFGTDKRLKLLDGCLCYPLDRAEVTQQLHLALLTDTRNFRKLGRKVAFFATLAVKFHSRSVRLLTNLQDEPESQRMFVKRYRLVFAPVDQKMRDLAVAFGRLDEANEHYLFEVK